MQVVLFLIGTFINKLAPGEAGEEVTSAVRDETEFHKDRTILFAARLRISAHFFATHRSPDDFSIEGGLFYSWKTPL